jgi:hypothetical protein
MEDWEIPDYPTQEEEDADAEYDENEERQNRQRAFLDRWRHDNDFMFVKRRDDEDWDELVRKVLAA